MNFNTLLLRLGISLENFVNKDSLAIPIEGGMLYEVEQSKAKHNCPFCNNENVRISGYYYTQTKCSESENFKDILRIKRVRFRCKKCGRTFSSKIEGIKRYSTISDQVERFIINDFIKPLTFAEIAKRYGLGKQRIIQIFDDKVKYVPRREMPRILCIDELKFSEEYDQNYCCVLYDFEKKKLSI